MAAMKLNWMTFALVSAVLAVSGCKKDKKTEGTTETGTAASGSSMAGSSMAGSSMAGSGMANPTEGSGTMAGSSMAGGSGAAASKWSDADVEKVIVDAIALMDEIGKGVTGKDCAAAAGVINSSLDKH